MKALLIITLFLLTINIAEAQPELGGAVDNPMITRTLTPLYACEERVIRLNFDLPKDEKRIWPLINSGCSQQIEAAQDACGLVADFSDDDCEAIINDKMRRYYTDVAREIMNENR